MQRGGGGHIVPSCHTLSLSLLCCAHSNLLFQIEKYIIHENTSTEISTMSLFQSAKKYLRKFFQEASAVAPLELKRVPLATTWVRKLRRFGTVRNSMCSCGSSRKFKHCCLRKSEAAAQKDPTLMYDIIRHRDIPKRLRA